MIPNGGGREKLTGSLDPDCDAHCGIEQDAQDPVYKPHLGRGGLA